MDSELTFSEDEFRGVVMELLGDGEVLPRCFKAYGKRLYLVGGVVRDFLFGLSTAHESGSSPVESLDLDFTTDARPEEIKAIIEDVVDNIWTQGERFGTIGCRIGSTLIEITTHRAEIYKESSRKPDVDFSSDIHADLSRRDFTINAMAIEVTDDNARIIDPFNGYDDLKARLLQTPLSAKISFSDDPLRMVRAARFGARFQLHIDESVTLAAQQLHERIDIVAIERIRVELEKLLDTEQPSRGLQFLQDTGLMHRILPELAECSADELEQLWQVVDHTSQGRLFRFVQLFWLFPSPESVRKISRRLRLSRVEADRVNALFYGVSSLEALLERSTSRDTEPPSVVEYREFLFNCHHIYGVDVDQLVQLITVREQVLEQASIQVSNQTSGRDNHQRDHVARIAALEHIAHVVADLDRMEGADTFKVPITGADIQSALHIEAGPQIGQALRYLQQQRFLRGPLSNDQALVLIKEWAATQ